MSTAADKRSRLVEAATKCVHEQGFNQATLADIASEAGVPLGNVYYYFKTKEDLGEAVIERRAADLGRLRDHWETGADPRERLRSFVRMTLHNRESLARSGCPVGTLCAELAKDGRALGLRASAIFADTLSWLESQFRALGRSSEARALAVHLLSALEGVSLLAHSFADSELIVEETRRLDDWLLGMEASASSAHNTERRE